jgi:hypothetical protein
MYQSHVASREVMTTLGSVMQVGLNDLPSLFGSAGSLNARQNSRR